MGSNVVMIGVVLAGGASRRMGRDKALVELAGQPLIAWVAAALDGVCPRVVISGRSWEKRERVDDPPGLHGPRAGLAAALALGEDVLLVAVDQPWVRVETLRGLVELDGTAVPLDGGIAQVTCARYDRRLDLSRGDESLQSIVAGQVVTRDVWSGWGEDGRSWFSVDTAADLARGLERFGPPRPG